MATEKILIFDEAGNAKRMKVRIARFLDNEPVTSSDKENIRTTLEVDGSQSGTFTTPLSVTSASDSSFTGGGNVTVSSGDVIITGDTSDAYTAGTLKLTAGNLGTNSIQLGDVSDADIGMIQYANSDNSMRLTTNGSERWRISASGNLIANGTGIDFGSAATSAGQGTGTTGSAANSVLSDYEFGSWVPRFEMTGANFAALTMDVIAAQYCKVGRHVHCQAMIRTDNVDTSGASGTVAVNGLPFVSETTASNYGGFSVGWSTAWVNAPNAGFVQPNSAYVHLTRNGTTGMSTITASDVTNGASANKNELIFTVSYIAST